MRKLHIVKTLAGLLTATLPSWAFATQSTPSKLDAFITALYTNVLDPLIFLLFGAAVLTFMWGVSGMVRNYADEGERLAGRRSIWWGLLGMFIMAGVLGIMCIIATTLGVPANTVPYC